MLKILATLHFVMCFYEFGDDELLSVGAFNMYFKTGQKCLVLYLWNKHTVIKCDFLIQSILLNEV